MESPQQLLKRMAEDPKRKIAESLSKTASVASILANEREVRKYHAEAAKAHSDAATAWRKTDYFDSHKNIVFHDEKSMQHHARSIDN